MQKCVSDYLDSVCAAIRGKALREAVRAELGAHMREGCRNLKDEGMDDEAAARAVVERMGDPAVLGKRIREANKSRLNKLGVWGGAALALLGTLVFILVAGGSIPDFIDVPGFIGVIVLASAYALINCGGRPSAEKFVSGIKSGSIYAGLVCMVISIINMLNRLDDLSTFGPNVSVAFLSVFYGLLVSAAARALESAFAPPEPGAIVNLLGE